MSVFVEGVGIVLLIPLLAVVIGPTSFAGPLQGFSSQLFALVSAETRFAKLLFLVAIFVVLLVVRAVIITLRDVALTRFDAGFVRQIRSRLTHHLAAAEWHVVAKLRHSRITHMMSADIERLNTATSLVLRDSVVALILVSQIGIAIYLSPALASFAVASVLIGSVALVPLLRRARRFGQLVTDANLSLINDVGQFLGALKLAKSQNLEDSFTREFDATMDGLTSLSIHYVQRGTLTRQAVATVAGVVGAIAMIVGVTIMNVPASILITLVVIFVRINGPATQLNVDFQHFVEALPAYEKIRQLETELAAAREAPAVASNFEPPAGQIAFQNVSFLHQESRSERSVAAGVQSLTLTIDEGSVLGVTGPSGSGKTTFADLLVGLFPPQSGKISIGGIALAGAIVPAWRNVVSYVTQDSFLFYDTIRKNLLWGGRNLDDEALWKALDVAGAADFVRHTRLGLDTVVGERGSLLSGGERQRISLARAILRRPKLLILDEATNAVGVEAEKSILERLVRLEPRPTIVIIAHRPESLRPCDRLLVFSVGRATVQDNVAGSGARLTESKSEMAG
jgi:ATP-binding cassette subfamily C protein